ncbi:hypothetical protein PLICRDRAFT_45226 [Plicaturopsis crispa FD-325 SS-3]|uniref:Uncharacterized protein n=1 Tax=Plicaturopsis crispa FD-325 SS-3 TaxID=944288 RepID=A0A0C9SRX8_PLICR|nr:hypothetical protein PLICRDRAFT_45226 [Plicaturopsis crispa FD-325 SS-3]
MSKRFEGFSLWLQDSSTPSSTTTMGRISFQRRRRLPRPPQFAPTANTRTFEIKLDGRSAPLVDEIIRGAANLDGARNTDLALTGSGEMFLSIAWPNHPIEPVRMETRNRSGGPLNNMEIVWAICLYISDYVGRYSWQRPPPTPGCDFASSSIVPESIRIESVSLFRYGAYDVWVPELYIDL